MGASLAACLNDSREGDVKEDFLMSPELTEKFAPLEEKMKARYPLARLLQYDRKQALRIKN